MTQPNKSDESFMVKCCFNGIITLSFEIPIDSPISPSITVLFENQELVP